MSKQKRKHTPQAASSSPNRKTTKSADGVVTGADYPTEEIKWWREAIEGLVIAIVLALLIRGFEAEAFVIPTGSMAPTLRGRHKDVACEQCEHQYAAGASLEAEQSHGDVVLTSCPMCGFPQQNTYDKGRDASFSGDRILVNKFAFDPLGVPERFDIIVFKNPNDAKQNYIKRLCGLPGETVMLMRGDIYVRKNDAEQNETWEIARKPPKKLRAMLQPVHDTDFIPTVLDENGLPPRWQADSNSTAWTTTDRHRTFDLASSVNDNWIRYRHIAPDTREWIAIREGKNPDFQGNEGELIGDSYAYNSFLNSKASFPQLGRPNRIGYDYQQRSAGKNWVGDLAVECNVEIKSDAGEFTMDLVEGGWHFRCRIDVSTGKATMTIQDPAGVQRPFDESTTAAAETKIQGAGSYRVMFSNIDSQLRLWVNNGLVTFDNATTYSRGPDVENERAMRPFFGGRDNPGDLAPVGVAGKNLEAHVKRLRVHRDKYYVAVKGGATTDPTMGDYDGGIDGEGVHQLFRSPEQWASTDLFNNMRTAIFVLEDFDDDSKDQFFPMGDNSPQSHDARVWSVNTNYVERQFLIGEAVLIYYPHPWHAKLPGEEFRSVPLIFYPKFSRMGIIR